MRIEKIRIEVSTMNDDAAHKQNGLRGAMKWLASYYDSTTAKYRVSICKAVMAIIHNLLSTHSPRRIREQNNTIVFLHSYPDEE